VILKRHRMERPTQPVFPPQPADDTQFASSTSRAASVPATANPLGLSATFPTLSFPSFANTASVNLSAPAAAAPQSYVPQSAPVEPVDNRDRLVMQPNTPLVAPIPAPPVFYPPSTPLPPSFPDTDPILNHTVDSSSLARFRRNFERQYMDPLAPYAAIRWGFFFALGLCYCIRVYLLQGYYIVTYGLGIFLLNLFIGFLTPLGDADAEGLPTTAPTAANDETEFKPFARRLPEFPFWLSCTKAVLVGFFLTLFSFFNIPVFWPILLVYFVILFVLTMKRQIKHMIEHRYLPWSWGKRKYVPGRARIVPPSAATATASNATGSGSTTPVASSKAEDIRTK